MKFSTVTERNVTRLTSLVLLLSFPILNSRPSRRAVAQAKRNIEHHYILVGITEEMRGFFELIEVLLPRFFKSAPQVYDENRE